MKPFSSLPPSDPRPRHGLRVALMALVVTTALAAAPTASAASAPASSQQITRVVLPDGSTLVNVPLVAIGGGAASAGGHEFSPAGCRIVYVDNPHFAGSVPGAIKVNAKLQCSAPVETLSLGVNMTNTTSGRRAAGPKNVTEDGTPYVENFNTFVVCSDSRLFQFQGDAGAVSVENGRGYANVAFGNVSQPLPCGYEGA